MSTPLTVKPRNRPPSLLACTTCRGKHLKCDAQMPVCGRCQDRDLTCTYLESRRGFNKGPKRTLPSDSGSSPLETESSTRRASVSADNDYQRPPDAHLGAENLLLAAATTGGLLDSSRLSPYQDGSESSFGSRNHQSGSVTSFSTQSTSGVYVASSPPPQGDDELLESFYVNFHGSHPFIIPRALYKHDRSILPEYVKTVMRFVGSHFVLSGYPQDTLRLRQAASAVTSDAIPDNGFKVQGMLLFTMALYARFEQAEAANNLSKTLELALRLGMNNREFSMRQSMGNPIVEESWRRTWWDLYVVNGLISAISGSADIFTLYSVITDVPLPCEESDYMHCRPLAQPGTHYEMQNRAFDDAEYPWSSFAYRVEAMRIMGTVMHLPSDDFASSTQQIETIDASISNFMLSLPPSKRELVEHDSKVDEVLFAAHMVINWASIMLHRPRSILTVVRSHYQTACTSKEELIGTPVMPYGNHTSKALRAANLLSSMTAIQTPMTKHTPCYTCAIAIGAIAHLPAYALEANVDTAAANGIKERLQLAISALNKIGEVWPMARMVKMQISQFARELVLTSQSVADAASYPTARIQAPRASAAPEGPRQLDCNDDSWLEDLALFIPPINANANQPSQLSMA